MHHILLNEAADKAADKPTEGYGTLYASLKDSVDADERIVAKQARICKRLATIEKHIRKVWGPVTVDEQEYLKELWTKQDAKLKKQDIEYEMASNNITEAQGHCRIIAGKWAKCTRCPCIAKVSNVKYWAARKCIRASARTNSGEIGRASCRERV